jgi:hypothetical protein
MRISSKKRDELYRVIREEIVNARIKLKLSPKDDVILAQVEPRIWNGLKEVMGLSDQHKVS